MIPPAEGVKEKVNVKIESEEKHIQKSTCRMWASCRSGLRDCEVESPPPHLQEEPCSAQPEDSEDNYDDPVDADENFN